MNCVGASGFLGSRATASAFLISTRLFHTKPLDLLQQQEGRVSLYIFFLWLNGEAMKPWSDSRALVFAVNLLRENWKRLKFQASKKERLPLCSLLYPPLLSLVDGKNFSTDWERLGHTTFETMFPLSRAPRLLSLGHLVLLLRWRRRRNRPLPVNANPPLHLLLLSPFCLILGFRVQNRSSRHNMTLSSSSSCRVLKSHPVSHRRSPLYYI